MTTLVIGASGATGKLLVEQLLSTGQKVKIIVRPESSIPTAWNDATNVSVTKAYISEIGAEAMVTYLEDCDAVASCLGHNLTLKGIFGKPKNLVTHAVRTLCEATIMSAPEKPIKFVLMNTAGNSNRDVNEPMAVQEKLVIGLLRLFLPPHVDNENAADFLRVKVGENNRHIQWVVVRPDTLINNDSVTEYSLHQSPTRSAIFNPGKTSRINVANLMVRLITDENLWKKWKGQMPVIYNGRENNN